MVRFPSDRGSTSCDPWSRARRIRRRGSRRYWLDRPAGTGGLRTFVHALVRDAVEEDLASVARVRWHGVVAETIERYYAPTSPVTCPTWPGTGWLPRPTTPEGVDRAVRWCERAADDAFVRLAWEDAARLYGAALDAGGQLAWDDRCRLLLGRARARFRSAELADALDDSLEAARMARSAGRTDLVAQAALVLDAVGDPRLLAAVRDLCEEALAAPDLSPALRARLLGQVALACFYLDPDRIDEASAAALAAAEASQDPSVIVAALRARQLARSGPDGVADRLALADRMTELGRRCRRPDLTMWGHLWRIDAQVQRGDLAAVGRELGTAVGHHVGVDPAVVERRDSVEGLPGVAGELGSVGQAAARAALGDLDGARASYRRYRPMATWHPPRYLFYQLTSWRIHDAVAVGHREDLVTLVDRLAPLRGHHLGAGAGGPVYGGPVDLVLGHAEHALGRIDAAVSNLRAAVDATRLNGARGFAVEAAVLLAEVLAERGAPGDAAEAADRPRGRSRRTRLARPHQPRDRRGAGGLGANRAESRPAHPHQARVQRPKPDRGLGRLPARIPLSIPRAARSFVAGPNGWRVRGSRRQESLLSGARGEPHAPPGALTSRSRQFANARQAMGRAKRSACGRSHSDTWVGCIVCSTTPTSSAVRLSRSTCWRSRALNA